MRLNRNDLCWCGSNKKYKQCHLAFDEKIDMFERKGYEVPDPELIKKPKDIEGIRKSAEINTRVLDHVAQHIKAGMTTEEINTLVHECTIAQGAIPAPLGYQGFPKSVCTSINDEVCHGIPSENRILQSGDIINVDVSTIYKGYFSDASRMFMIGEVDEKARRLVTVAKECLDKGLAAVKPWKCIGDIGAAILSHAQANGYSVVVDIGGHGVGLAFHEDPFISHVSQADTGMLMVPGMIFTIEPMINGGTEEVVEDAENGWTIYTEDEELSAQWEYTVLVTETGAEILTY